LKRTRHLSRSSRRDFGIVGGDNAWADNVGGGDMKLLFPLFFVHCSSLFAQDIQRFVAIDNVCAWPALTVLPDGSLNATIFGKPSHGQMPGAVEVWNSADGEFWRKRGIPAPNEPHTNRMNHAAGMAKNGDLLVLCSGWTDVKQPQRPKQAAFRDDILPL
jgi:hypothetical protein